MAYTWKFPVNDDAPFNGLSNLQEFFKANKIASLAREICQNSLDAVLDDNKPVEICFEKLDVPTDTIPDINGLRKNLELAYKFYSTKENVRDKEYFKAAIDVISNETISILKISDYNTKGLLGSHERDMSKMIKTPWGGLTRGQGFSAKTDGAGGSHGIGKNAVFTCSSLGTVFFSTYDMKEEQAWEGLAILASYFDDDNHQTIGTGYLNSEQANIPVLDKQFNEIPGNEIRTDAHYGTDIFIIGLIPTETSLSQSIIVSAIDSFFIAIHEKKLRITVKNENTSITLDDSNLFSLATDYTDQIKKETNDYLEVIKSNATVAFVEDNFMDLGSIELYLNIKNPEFKKRVAVVRKNGMLIKYWKISSSIGSAGILILRGKRLNEMLASVENPTHTSWDLEHVGLEKRHQIDGVLKRLRAFLAEKYDSLISDVDEESVDSSTGDFLPDIGEGESNNKQDVLSSEIVEAQKPRRVKPRSVIHQEPVTQEDGTVDYEDSDDTNQTEEIPDLSGTGHADGDSSSDGDGGGNTPGNGDGPIPSEQNRTKAKIKVASMRILFYPKNVEKGEWILVYTPKIDANNVTMKLSISGESQTIESKLISAICPGNNLSVENDTISGFNCAAGRTIRFILKFDSRISFSIGEPEVYGNN